MTIDNRAYSTASTITKGLSDRLGRMRKTRLPQRVFAQLQDDLAAGSGCQPGWVRRHLEPKQRSRTTLGCANAKRLPALTGQMLAEDPLRVCRGAAAVHRLAADGRGGEAAADRGGARNGELPELRQANPTRGGLRVGPVVGRHLLWPGMPGGLPRGVLP